MQTSLTSSEDRNKAFIAGTTDLVSKPLDRTELLARVRIHLESRVLIRHLQSYRARVEGELAIARSMHEHLLPSPTLCATLESLAGVTCAPTPKFRPIWAAISGGSCRWTIAAWGCSC